MRIRSVICGLLGAVMLTGSPCYAIEQQYDSERSIGIDGWVDSFEDTALYPLNDTILRTTLSTQSNMTLNNKFIIAEDPKGQNGHCMAWEYSMFTQAAPSNAHRNNPSFEPIFPTQTFTIGNGGDVMMSFDMYLPENFYCVGADTTSMMIQVFPSYTGSASSSDYQNITLDKNGITVPGFPTYPLPVGHWFNIKYILHCNVQNNEARADLYVDNMEVGKDVVTSFRLMGGRGFENIRENGIKTLRATLSTTDSGVEIDPPYRFYMDNIEIRSMKGVEALTYGFTNNFAETDTLSEGMNRFDIKLRNLGNEAVVPVVGLMLYRDGELCAVEMDNSKTVYAGTDADYSIAMTVDSVDDGDYELRTFVWDSAETLNSVKTQMTLKE